MKNVKTIICLISLIVAGITNVWGAGEYTWDSETKTLTIHKAGAFADGETTDFTDVTKRAWKDVINTAQHLIVEDGITHLGAYTFYRCSVAVDVKLPASLVSVGHAAFYDSKVLSKIYFEGTPNQWASIDFRTNDSYRRSHPFYASSATDRNFYFYGGTTVTAVIVLTPGITTVKPFAFYNATGIQGINIPGSVTTIGTNAFNVSSYSSAWVAINKKKAPATVATDAFNTSTNLYVPTGHSGYSGTSPWSSFSHIYTQAVSGSCTMSSGSASWALGTDGVLTITGHGVISTYASSSDYEWERFRRLVHKVVIQNDESGDITSVGNALKWNWATTEISINQNTIPTSDVIGGNSTTGGNLINTVDNVTVKIKTASLTDASVSRLKSTPWNSDKLKVALSETVTFYDNGLNTDTLQAIKTYVKLPFSLQLKRTLSNEMYNTFCSPINMSADKIVTLFGSDTELVELDPENTGLDEDDRLVIAFKGASSIVAGTPYLIMPKNNVANPSFTNVDPASIATAEGVVETELVDFHGTLNNRPITAAEVTNQSIVILTSEFNGEHQLLNWANGGTLKGMRAYWELKEDAPDKVYAKRPVMRFHGQSEEGQTPTGVDKTQTEVKAEKVMENGVMYIIKNGVKYSVMGERVK